MAAATMEAEVAAPPPRGMPREDAKLAPMEGGGGANAWLLEVVVSAPAVAEEVARAGEGALAGDPYDPVEAKAYPPPAHPGQGSQPLAW